MATLEKILTFDKLEKPVKQHLKKVYSCLSMTLLAAAAGGYVHLFTGFMQAGLLTVIASIGLLILLRMTPHAPENNNKRMGYLAAFGFFSGIGLGPLMDMVIRIDPSIIPTALLGTGVIFICFTMTSLLSDDRKFLYMGGVLLSGLSWLFMLSFMNIFMGSRMLYEINLYAGFVIFCGFILYDTQLIVEKRRHGDDDFVWHSVDLFIDFIQVFRRLMIILANKEEKKKRKN